MQFAHNVCGLNYNRLYDFKIMTIIIIIITIENNFSPGSVSIIILRTVHDLINNEISLYYDGFTDVMCSITEEEKGGAKFCTDLGA